jgi:hypothetical protein
MIVCGDDCVPLCNHCRKYDFDNRRCRFDDSAKEPDDGMECKEFFCRLGVIRAKKETNV